MPIGELRLMTLIQKIVYDRRLMGGVSGEEVGQRKPGDTGEIGHEAGRHDDLRGYESAHVAERGQEPPPAVRELGDLECAEERGLDHSTISSASSRSFITRAQSISLMPALADG